jgi:hypothetical protein
MCGEGHIFSQAEQIIIGRFVCFSVNHLPLRLRVIDRGCSNLKNFVIFDQTLVENPNNPPERDTLLTSSVKLRAEKR